MPILDYQCNNPECGFKDEFIVGSQVQNTVPEVCPKCGAGKLESQFSAKGQAFDVVGGYEYSYGKKAWRNRMSASEQSKVLSGESSPY